MEVFAITDHARARWAAFQRVEGLPAELAQSVPFGAQHGGEQLRLLPCGLVAAVSKDRAVKTILTYQHALANMQSRGLLPDSGTRRRPRTPRRRRRRQ